MWAEGRALAASRLRQQVGAIGKSLRDRTRERLARHYLTTTALSDTEIAFLIGYEVVASFHRAFRSWTGSTPGQTRAAAV